MLLAVAGNASQKFFTKTGTQAPWQGIDKVTEALTTRALKTLDSALLWAGIHVFRIRCFQPQS